MLILFYILIGLGGIVVAYFTFDFILGVLLARGNITFADKVKKAGARLTPTEKEGVTTFVTDKEFKILFIADTHIGGGPISGYEDRRALSTVENIVRAAMPNLVIVGGDLVYTSALQSGNNDNIKALKMLARLFEKMEVYWAPVFGNHDSERAKYSRREMGETLESNEFSHCLFKCGDDGISGVGNYIINIECSSGAVTQTMFFLDTGEYVNATRYGTKYDNVHPDQIEWYEKTLRKLGKANARVGAPLPPSLMFVHIPFAEYLTAYSGGNIVYGKKRERICVGRNYGLFDKIVSLGSTKAVFCGHDHTNDFAAQYRGVRLCYGMSIDYLAYVWTDVRNPARGGTVITLRGGQYTAERLHMHDVHKMLLAPHSEKAQFKEEKI